MVNSPIDRKIAAVAARQSGHITRKQLLDLGLTPAEIYHRVKLGRLICVYRGVYAVGHRRTEPLARLKATVLAGGPEAVISFSSAVFLWGLTKRLELPPEITSRTHRSIDGIRIHGSTTLTRKDITTQRGIRTTSPARTLLDTAPRYTDDRLTRAVNDLRLAGFLHLSELAELLHRRPKAPGAHRLVSFVENTTGITRSMFEDAFQKFVRHFDLPTPQVNTRVAGYEVDALFAAEKVIVELDGWDFHRDRGAFESDRERDAALLALGYVTVRITWHRLTRLSDKEGARLKKILADRQPGTPAPSTSASRPSSGPSDRR